MSTGEVPFLQWSQAQSQAAPEVSDVRGFWQAQVWAGLPGLLAFHCLLFWKAARNAVSSVLCPQSFVHSRCLVNISGVGGLFLEA